MSTPIDDGGPAFPHGEIVQDMLDEEGRFVGNRVGQPSAGMTLRDWFAGQALQGTYANPEFFRMLVNLRKEMLGSGRTALECDKLDQQVVSTICITAADSLIAALKGGAE
jgi:hypothetical protein